MNIYYNLSETEFNEKKYREGYVNLKLADSLKDIIQTDAQNNGFLELQTKYETEKKEQANLVLKNEKQKYQLAILFGIILVAINSLALFKLSRKNKQLDEYGNFRDQIFSIISHDLKSPIAALAGLSKKASYLMREKEMERLEMMSKNIDASVIQITTLINNLLAWSISQNTIVAAKMETFTLLPVVNEIVFLYAEVANIKMTNIKIVVPEGLKLYGNKNGISVIVRNLMDNAFRHTNKSQSKILISARKQGSQVFFQITNDAYISSAEVVKKIREQLKGINQNCINNSSGLGLELVFYFVKKHNASIEMKSDIGIGTSFLVILPQ